jgi:hypothetical protein
MITMSLVMILVPSLILPDVEIAPKLFRSTPSLGGNTVYFRVLWRINTNRCWFSLAGSLIMI